MHTQALAGVGAVGVLKGESRSQLHRIRAEKGKWSGAVATRQDSENSVGASADKRGSYGCRADAAGASETG